MANLTIRTETVDQVIGEILPLIEQHADEVGYPIMRDVPIDVDVERYRLIEAAGMLRIYAARHEGELVGYAAFILGASLDRRTMIAATEVGVFVKPEYRKGTNALRLLQHADNSLRDEGVDMVVYHNPSGSRTFSTILIHRGFSMVDEVYARRL